MIENRLNWLPSLFEKFIGFINQHEQRSEKILIRCNPCDSVFNSFFGFVLVWVLRRGAISATVCAFVRVFCSRVTRFVFSCCVFGIDGVGW